MKSKNHIYHNSNIDFTKTIGEAKQRLKVLEASSIAVVEDKLFKGVLFEEDLANYQQASLGLSHVENDLRDLYLLESFSIFDWFKIVSLYPIQNIPLVSLSREYLGEINLEDIILKLSKTGLNVSMSSVLILSKLTVDFKYSEVFQILEANGAKIYGSYINHSDEQQTEIIVNIHHQGLNELLQSFRRYGYSILSYHQEDQHRETLQNNSDYLSKFLTV